MATSINSKQDLYDIIRSLTEQLEKSDKALVERETQYRSQVKALEHELRIARDEKETWGKEKHALISEAHQEKTQRQDAEHRLAISYQALTNAQREAQQAQDSLALANKHHASSLSQSRQEADNWKEQARTNLEHVNGRLQSQSQQIDDLMAALNQHMANQSRQIAMPTGGSYFGPLISVPLPNPSGSRVKQEDGRDSNYYQDKQEDDESTSQDVEDDEDDGGQEYSPAARRGAPSKHRQQRGVRQSNPKRNTDRSRPDYRDDPVDEEEDDDDEMAIGYSDRQSLSHTLPPQTMKHPPARRYVQSSPTKQPHPNATRRGNDFSTKTPTRPPGQRAPVTGGAGAMLKKRKVV